MVPAAGENRAIRPAALLCSLDRGGIAPARHLSESKSEMTENVAILLAVLVAANVVLIVVALWRARSRRRAATRRVAPGTKGVATDASGVTTRPSAGPRPSIPVMTAFDAAPSVTRTDSLTGLLIPAEWSRLLTDEETRIHRYGRPATVVLIELDGLDRLAATLGEDVADRVVRALADALRRHARGADHVARLGTGRFGVLLPETGEVEAVNYVERVRHLCELWLESGAIALRLAIGWASPAHEAGLDDAFATAQERMYAELRRGSSREAGSEESDAAPPASGLEGAPAPA